MKKFLAQSYIYILLVMLYAPLVIIVVFSFTEARALGNWTGFSTKLYESLFTGGMANSHSLSAALKNTLIIATISALVATFLGTFSAIGINSLRGRKRKAISFLNSVPMLNPDIITGVSLFLLFVSLGISQGYTTVVLAHITFCTPFVVLNVMPRLMQLNPNIYEAALDLGATPMQAMRKVIIPQLRSAMFTGFILSFAMSIDDFVVTVFTKGNKGLETLSTFIYNDARKGGLTPELRPLMSIVFITILTLLIVANIRSSKQSKNKQK